MKQKIGQFNLLGKLRLRNTYAAGQSSLLPGLVGAMMSSFIVGRSIVGKEEYSSFLRGEAGQLRRVVISGVGAVSALGNDVPSLVEGIEEGRSGVRYMEGWDRYIGLRSLVGAPAELRNEKAIPRKSRRSMGRMSIFGVQAAEQALADAGMERQELSSGRTGCVIGSTMGGAESLNETFETMLPERDLSRLTAMKFFQCVSHTAAMNVAQHLGITGCVMATSAACASSLQAIGTGYDLIRMGKQDVMLCGGAEELHPTVTASFDILFATSTGYNDDPQRTPRPFDSERDGLVCGEGCGILVLEEYERALERNAEDIRRDHRVSHCGERGSRKPVQ